jgi:hypothetical protein
MLEGWDKKISVAYWLIYNVLCTSLLSRVALYCKGPILLFPPSLRIVQ